MSDTATAAPARPASTAPDRFVREPECAEITGLSRTARWRLERQGKFPRRHYIMDNVCAWRLSDLMAWMDERAGKAA